MVNRNNTFYLLFLPCAKLHNIFNILSKSLEKLKCTKINVLKIAQDWLSHFEKVLQSGKSNDLEDCFHSESFAAISLAFTGTISPYGGAKEISLGLNSFQKIAQAHSFRIIDKHAQPRLVNRLGRPVIEAIFAFETKLGRGEGVVRVPENSQKTALDIFNYSFRT